MKKTEKATPDWTNFHTRGEILSPVGTVVFNAVDMLTLQQIIGETFTELRNIIKASTVDVSLYETSLITWAYEDD